MSWKWIESEGVEYYVRTKFEGGGYKVEMTDLQQSWVEGLDRGGFVARGEEVSGGAIDFSTASQIEFIKERLENALLSTEEAVVKRKSEGLTVEVSVDLRPIPDPLNWRFELTTADHVTPMNEIVHGLIGISDFLVARISELNELLVLKDGNIKKFQEKFMELGVKWETTHRYKQALEPFNKEQWWKEKKQMETEEPLHINEAMKNIADIWGYNGKGRKIAQKRKPQEPVQELISPSKKRKRLKIPKEKSPSPSTQKGPSGPKWDF